MSNILLFGPPGIGKTTLVATLKSKGYKAVDLEDIYPSQLRRQLPVDPAVDGVLFGAADLSPKTKYPNCKKVLLTLESEEEYAARRGARDAAQPEKGRQKAQTLAAWDGDYYDEVVIANSRAADKIEALLRE